MLCPLDTWYKQYVIAIMMANLGWLLTTSSLITTISAFSCPITTVSRSDALSIAATECSTLTGSCKLLQ